MENYDEENSLSILNCFVGSDGFEPPKAKPAELQSAPFGHSGNCPLRITLQRYGYFFNLQLKSIIFMAVMAASLPLFP